MVLLIIFMIAAPGIARSGMDVSLPGARSAGSNQNQKMKIALTRDGRFFIENNLTSQRDLEAELIKRVKANPAISVVLNADSAVPHGTVVEILDLIRSKGVRKIYVGTVRK